MEEDLRTLAEIARDAIAGERSPEQDHNVYEISYADGSSLLLIARPPRERAH